MFVIHNKFRQCFKNLPIRHWRLSFKYILWVHENIKSALLSNHGFILNVRETATPNIKSVRWNFKPSVFLICSLTASFPSCGYSSIRKMQMNQKAFILHHVYLLYSQSSLKRAQFWVRWKADRRKDEFLPDIVWDWRQVIGLFISQLGLAA